MNEIIINIFLVVGIVTSISILIAICVVSYFFCKSYFVNRNWYARSFIDSAIKTRLKGLSKEDLEKWFESTREKHKKINEEI